MKNEMSMKYVGNNDNEMKMRREMAKINRKKMASKEIMK